MKKALLIVLVLLLACCLCSVVGFGLLGHFSLNGQCVWKGPFATNLTGNCAPSNTETTTNEPSPLPDNMLTYSGRNSAKFTFNYDKNLELEDNPTITGIALFLRVNDSEEQAITNFKDNINISNKSIYLEQDKNNCDVYADSVIQQLRSASSLQVDESTVINNIETINGSKVCHVSWSAKSQGTEFNQDQYVFSNKTANATYILTLSTGVGSSYTSTLLDTVESFEIL